MFSNPFEAALSQPESDASHPQLSALLPDCDFSGPQFPTLAEDYLYAFCDSSRSPIQRRWIGITVARMLEKPHCAARIQGLSAPLQNLGAIILSHEEPQMVRIIAGLIMRQGLEQSINYHKFWPSEKAPRHAPSFPRRADPDWVSNFDVFLDLLNASPLKSSKRKTSFSHVASLITADGFQCGEPENSLSATVLEAGMLTIIMSDVRLRNCHFVDIPASHILSARSEPSGPHDPLIRATECESYSLVIALKAEPWSYCVNSTQRNANEMSLNFKRSSDASHWEDLFKQHMKADGTLHSKSSLPTTFAQPHRTTSRASTEEEKIPVSNLKRTRCSKGKLPRVSRAAKQKALLQLCPQPDHVETDSGKEEKQETGTDAPSATSLLQRKSHHSKTVLGKKASRSIKTGKAHVRHSAQDDEDYVPESTGLKRKVSAKSKAYGELEEDDKQIKRLRTSSDSPTDSAIVAAKRRGQPRTLAKTLSPTASSRDLLIEGGKAPMQPTDSDATFKKPTLPAHVTKPPSTPTKPKKKLLETPGSLRTARDVKRYFCGDVFSQIPSSPPIFDEPDEGVGWSRDTAAEAAILSSNSKPVPASPSADSTAISGHADCDDVAYEKQTGDSRIAKSDPFTRRSKGGKVTSFIRRLTGEESTEIASDLETDTSQERLTISVEKETMDPLEIALESDMICPTLACTQVTTYDTPVKQVVDRNMGMESELSNADGWDDEQELPESGPLPVWFNSSPPALGLPSSRSSTCAAPLLSPQSALPSSEADEINWEMSLEPHQRNLRDLLVRTSKRIVRHVVDKESGLTDIAEMFAKDGECVLQSFQSRPDNDYEGIFRDMEDKRDALRTELECASKRVADERRRVHDLV